MSQFAAINEEEEQKPKDCLSEYSHTQQQEIIQCIIVIGVIILILVVMAIWLLIYEVKKIDFL